MKQFIAILETETEDWNLHELNPETRNPKAHPIISGCVSISELIDEAELISIPAEAIMGKALDTQVPELE